MRVEFYVGFPDYRWIILERDIDIDPNEGNETLDQVGYDLATTEFVEPISFVGVYCIHDDDEDENFEEE